MDKFKSINPFDNSLIGEFEFDDKKKVDEILNLLTVGQNIQKKISAHERSEILFKLSKLLETYSEELSHLITIETGKTISDSRVELSRAQNTAFCASVEARKISGEVLDSDAYLPKKGRMGIVTRRPIGTVLCITPFNFPINLALHKIAPAFAAGNTIFFKPSPFNYQSGKRLIEICYEAGMPREVIQFCYPNIEELSRVIKGDKIQCISFTGGTKTADAIAKNAGRKKLLFELGGNDPMIVMPDADIESAVINAINNRFGTAGQKCTASKKVFIHNDVYEKFKEILLEKSKSINVGNPLDEKTFCGPLVSKEAADQVQKRVNDAISLGAQVLLGSHRIGNIIYPTVLENVSLNSELIIEETFGPVIPLLKFNDLDELIKLINSSEFGLQAGVFTNDIRIIQKLFDELEVGALAVNDGPGFRSEHFPFGGVKNSGMGREGIKYAMEEMSVLKTLIL